MQEISDWLKKLGMFEYAQRFAENRIDFSVLRDLTDQDLKDLGIVLGDRRRMLRAIAELAGDNTPVTAQRPPVTEGKPQDTAERRQVTVVFSDLVASTALSARMDPEDLREVISAYQKCVVETVHRFDGFVAKFMGDGVLVYFGYPQAHEDDAERAVRAGLELIAAVTMLKSLAPLQARVGIATGLVVVGDLIGSGEAQERGIVGETPNLAARLQGIAEPNTVVVAESTRRLLGNLFELEDLGARDLKGIAEPTRAWAALRVSSVESRFEALHTTDLTDLVGREEELELLLRRWSRAKTGGGQVVLLSGEAGVGKSRLTVALMERLAKEPHTRLRYFCSPQHTDSALYPIIGQTERAAGLTHDDNAQAKLDKLDALLAQTSTQDAALFAEMLSLPNDGRYPALDTTPQQRRERTLEALRSQLAGLARQNPVLMIFEDVHWIDPTSLEALGRSVDRIKTLPALLIVTFRPEFNPPWVGQSHVASLTLNRLGEREAAAIIARLVGNQGLSPDVVAEIVERTDGIPLFVEEMTKAVLEADTEGAARRAVAAAPSPALAVPTSLHASLMARLDRLGPAKEVAQIGAAIGRGFSHGLLAAVVKETEAELVSALDRLIHAGLLFRQGLPPHADYLFKHALVRDAAYGMLLRETKRELHARIGTKIEEIFPHMAEAQPDLLAYHFAEGRLREKAIEYWLKAGQQSVSRADMTEALAHLNKGLTLLCSLPENAWRRHQELTIQVAIGSALMTTRGPASPELGAAYGRARDLWESLNRPVHFEPMIPLWSHHYLRGETEVARQIAAELVQAGLVRDDPAVKVIGDRYLAMTYLIQGDFTRARGCSKDALTFKETVRRRSLEDEHIASLALHSRALFALGYLDQAHLTIHEALMAARNLAHRYSLSYALTNALLGEWGVETVPTIMEHAEELVAQNIDWLSAYGAMFRGWCLSALGEEREGADKLMEGLVAYRASGSILFVPFFLLLLADTHGKAGHRTRALDELAEGLGLVEKTQERWIEPELHRRHGELLRLEGDHKSAEVSFNRALDVARRQSAKTWELRAAISLARLWSDQGKQIEARELIAPLYRWFTQGFERPPLQEAKKLLDELSQGMPNDSR
jgi:class 3 adenylate cyclase/predicted ATPase